MFRKPVREMSSSLTALRFTFIATDAIDNVCGSVRKFLSDNVIRFRARNDRFGT